MGTYSLVSLEGQPKLAEALGNMVVTWAQAEIGLLGSLARIAGIGLNMAQIGYYRIPTFEARVKFIQAILVEWNPPPKFDKDAIATAIAKLAKLSSARNHWIHGDWCFNDERNEILIFDHRSASDSPSREKPVKAADVENHCEAVAIRTKALQDLIAFDEISP